MNTTVEMQGARELPDTLLALWQLTKPGVTRLVMVTMAAGACVAPGALEWPLLLLAMFGTALVVGSANALNMYLERDCDALMERTRLRPLPTGRISPELALWFGVGIGLAGLCLLTFLVNPMAGLVAAVALVSYVLIYTPLKRVTPFALYVGAIPGAVPPVIGWASMTGELGTPALMLFAILFAWQLPHFLAISMFRHEDYRRAGLVVYPNTSGMFGTKLHMLLTLVALITVTLLPPLAGMAGTSYLVVAALAGAAFLIWGLMGLRRSAGLRWARSLFFASMPYLVIVFGALVFGAA